MVDWSARHTRLRYQTVLMSILLFMAVKYGVKDITLPFFISIEEKPSTCLVLIGISAFYVFSAGSFLSQHLFERRMNPDISENVSLIIKRLKQKVLEDKAALKAYLEIARRIEGELSNQIESDDTSKQLWLEEKDSIIYSKLSDWADFLKSRYEKETSRYEEDISKLFTGQFSKWALVSGSFNDALDAFKLFGKRSSGKSQSGDRMNVFFRVKNVKKMPADISEIEKEISSVSSAFEAFEKDLGAFKTHRFIHAGLLSFWLPITFSITLIGLSIIEIVK